VRPMGYQDGSLRGLFVLSGEWEHVP
jgi:hypothetical protein